MDISPDIISGVDLDPLGEVQRLGLVALSTDLTFERDAAKVVPQDRGALHVSRIAFANPTTPANLRAMAPRLSDAADLLVPGVELAAICFGCTSASVTIGDAVVDEAFGRVRPGVPVVTPARAAVAAFGALGMRRIALLTPYLVETTGPVQAYFTAAGLDVVRTSCLDMADDREIARISGRTIQDTAAQADSPDAEAIFISCTAMPALGLIARIEDALGKPVVTSNQASLWQMLTLSGLDLPKGFGQLFG